MPTPIVKSGEIEVTAGRAKSTNQTYKVSGTVTNAEGTIKLPFPGGLITAKDEKQACRYALAHVRYLGLTLMAGSKLAWKLV